MHLAYEDKFQNLNIISFTSFLSFLFLFLFGNSRVVLSPYGFIVIIKGSFQKLFVGFQLLKGERYCFGQKTSSSIHQLTLKLFLSQENNFMYNEVRN